MSRRADLGQEVTFHDPHPGFAGAAIPIPGAVKRVAEALDGRTMTLREAIAMLREVTDGEVRAVPDHRYLSLRLGGDTGPIHIFRVIRYREKSGS